MGSARVTAGNAAKQPETERNPRPFPATRGHKDAVLSPVNNSYRRAGYDWRVPPSGVHTAGPHSHMGFSSY
ncbi:hypothetical protein ARTHRO9V_90346 [Arthrobacter sp. 9V]|nr:hypothetical protein ARTHRO9V_90346 [Arthrobacter sp. 9V]